MGGVTLSMNVGDKTGCFLIGCGPSLNTVDVTRLSGVDSITFNRSFVAWDRWGFHPTYYACFDETSLSDNVEEISSLVKTSDVRRFFLNGIARELGIEDSPRVTYVTLNQSAEFSLDVENLSDFGNVGASSLQILAALGYTKAAMIGIDARYSSFPDADVDDQGFMRTESDDDHFIPEYGRGKRRVACPDLDKLLGSWPHVAEECAKKGLDVRIASPGSALTCFEHITFEEAISWIET